ncbi:MAG: hypothetical protein JWP92_2339 [Caulobacter sp.]|nr:hypothetical protein [Caulobacter sp.]
MTPGSTTDLSIDDHAAPNQARSARALVQAVRWRTGLSQDEFAHAFHIPRELLADLELGRARADDALTAYLRVIDHAPEVVREALDRAGI